MLPNVANFYGNIGKIEGMEPSIDDQRVNIRVFSGFRDHRRFSVADLTSPRFGLNYTALIKCSRDENKKHTPSSRLILRFASQAKGKPDHRLHLALCECFTWCVASVTCKHTVKEHGKHSSSFMAGGKQPNLLGLKDSCKGVEKESS